MNQLPLFVSIRGKPVILLGEGDAADAKRRLIERAGGICVSAANADARLAFIAIDDRNVAAETAAGLKARGLLVNVVDQPNLCDFTTPAIVDRDPLLVAIGTGGASAGLAKMVRQAVERMLPARIGELALQLQSARERLRTRWPEAADRRRQIDAALVPGGLLDPLDPDSADRLEHWLEQGDAQPASGIIRIELGSSDPEELTLRAARLLGQADHLFIDGPIGEDLVNRARADAVRHVGAPPPTPPSGLVIHLRLGHGSGDD
ncbi:MAG: siroheme synthase [Sphingomonadales bacterium]|jgi:uroporphyrin-III C-methyltransferase/precorrin-2 dehydrogenase/sirohydrochlorin ferrochelatase|nr:siroheme synthase [Sphingomonadales bacterium]MBK9004999.1 siroheme synthase [Sphingomonadales bacterium]MBK9267268.1 siroheme synthase [Sphingomonadales bacterium]MBP6433596.1 siroheme synthase [Sphingorhabdus sp.]